MKRVQKRIDDPFPVHLVPRQFAILEIPSTEGLDAEEDIHILDCNGNLEVNLRMMEMKIKGLIHVNNEI